MSVRLWNFKDGCMHLKTKVFGKKSSYSRVQEVGAMFNHLKIMSIPDSRVLQGNHCMLRIQWMTVCQKVPKLYFQSYFFMSQIERIF